MTPDEGGPAPAGGNAMPGFATKVLLLAGLTFLVLLSPANTPGGAAGAAAAGELSGDVNCSGGVDAVDALQVLRSVAGLTTNADCLDTAGDTDCDDGIDAVDALRILRYVAGMPNQYAEGCTHIGEPVASSDELIAEALEAGEITEEEATVYRVLAAFGDSRLPEEYSGAPSDLPDSDAAMMAALQFNSLSQESQDVLGPFLLPPTAPGSWTEQFTAGTVERNQANTWTGVPTADGKVIFWASSLWPGDFSLAQDLATIMMATIWPTLIGYVGEAHAPISDAGLPDNGGDGALDVYLWPVLKEAGLTVPRPPVGYQQGDPCERLPAFILLQGAETLPGPLRAQVLAHELFHAIEFTYDVSTNCYVPEYRWFMEASATWAMDFVYPDVNGEHATAEEYLKKPERAYSQHDYGAYLFLFYLTRKNNAPGLVRSMWEGFSTATSLQGIENVLQPFGGFDAAWPEFALYAWNTDPVPYYKNWDNLQKYPVFTFVPLILGSESKLEMPLFFSIGTPGMQYVHAHIPDSGGSQIRLVQFKNTLAGQAHVAVQALVKIGGVWEAPRDWTEEESVTFCRDKESEHVEDIVIIVSHSDWQQLSGDPWIPASFPKLVAHDSCGWQGEATETHQGSVAGESVDHYTATAEATDLVFEPDEAQDAGDWLVYKLASGTLKLTISLEVFDCVDGQPGFSTVTGTYAVSEGTLRVSDPDKTPPGQLKYSGQAASTDLGLMATVDCEYLTVGYGIDGMQWFSTGGEQLVGGDPTTISGEYAAGSSNYSWELHSSSTPPE